MPGGRWQSPLGFSFGGALRGLVICEGVDALNSDPGGLSEFDHFELLLLYQVIEFGVADTEKKASFFGGDQKGRYKVVHFGPLSFVRGPLSTHYFSSIPPN